MKKILYAFKPFIKEISRDFMLVACMIAPIVVGLVFKFLLPRLETLLCEYFKMTQILYPYYAGFDIVLIIMSPLMLCFAGVMVILEEVDCGVAKYYFVTPLGKTGYLFSRIVIFAIAGFWFDIVLLMIFTISGIDAIMIIVLSVGGSLLSIITALFVVAFSKNKMEGMALVKLCGIMGLGIPVAYLVENPIRYLFGIFPSFWMAELCVTGNYIFVIPILFLSVVSIFWLYNRFQRKLL